MLRGIETAAKGMESILHKNDAIAQNMANINTTGYKKNVLIFKDIQEVMINKVNSATENKPAITGSLSVGSEVASVVVDFSQGNIAQTQRPLDLSINGDGFFKLKMPDGKEAYTRNGNFIINQDGLLSTVDGNPVLGKNGVIQLDTVKNQDGSILFNRDEYQLTDVYIREDGQITIKGNEVEKLDIVDFENKNNLVSIGKNNFEAKDTKEAKQVEARNFQLSQGSLETSNSNVVENMVNSITAMRTYETLNNVVKTTSQTLQKNINMGKVLR